MIITVRMMLWSMVLPFLSVPGAVGAIPDCVSVGCAVKLPRYLDDKEDDKAIRILALRLGIHGWHKHPAHVLVDRIEEAIDAGAERAFNAGLEVGRGQR